MKNDGVMHPVKWRPPESPAIKSSRKVLAVKMNNFFDENLKESNQEWGEQKKRRVKKSRPVTATLAKPRLLNIALLGKIDMSLMKKELLSVYRLMRVPLDSRRSMMDKKLALTEKESKKERKSKSEDTASKSSSPEVIIRKDTMKEKSAFKLFPTVKTVKKGKVDAIFGPPTSKPLLKPCESCGRDTRPERLHAHPHRLSLSPSRSKASPASGRRSTMSEVLDAKCSLNEKRSPSRKSADNVIVLLSPCQRKPSEEGVKRSESKSGDAPPICTFCGRRFGTSSLPIHEAKCRERRERKSAQSKSKHTDLSTDKSRELSPHKLTPRISTPRMNDSRKHSPMRKAEEPKWTQNTSKYGSFSDVSKQNQAKLEDFQAFHPSHKVRRSPINITVLSGTHFSSTDTNENLDYDRDKSKERIEWTSHLRSLVKCSLCERNFAPDRVLRHQAVCDGSSKRLNSNVSSRKKRSTFGARSSAAHLRYPGCQSNDPGDEKQLVDTWSDRIVIDMTSDNKKGYSGTIAIIGGSQDYISPPYFAAMGAIRAGADAVLLFCTKAAGDIIKGFNPDIFVFPYIDGLQEKMLTMLSKVDLVVLGPGLDVDAHTLNVIIPRVIAHCKVENKPLILDFTENFMTQVIMNQLINYPKAGVIIIPNVGEFEKMYELIKSTATTSSGNVAIDYVKYANLFILRKGCSDVGISSDLATSWVLPSRGCPKRSSHQGHLLTGITATFFMWATKALPVNMTQELGSSLQASVATYGAAKLTRQTCEMTYNVLGRSMVTSDMLDWIPKAIYGFDSDK